MANFKFKKKYGQNFLQDETVTERIVASINPAKEDLIIEIGPGAGALTKKLKRYDCNVIAFEIDKEVQKYLDPLSNKKTKIIYEDFLTSDVQNRLKEVEFKDLYIIGNLPYYITTPILEKIIDLNLKPKEVVIMVQKEVADRFLAKPQSREYGYMTVLLRLHFNISKIVDVDKRAFKPIPKVDSTVIKFTHKETPDIDYSKFKEFLKDCFRFKRKTLNNNLYDYNRKDLEPILHSREHSLASRAEELNLETFIELSQTALKINGGNPE